MSEATLEPAVKRKTTTRKCKRSQYKRSPDSFSRGDAEKKILLDLILTKGMSLHDAAVAGNVDACNVHMRLFDSRPSEAQLARAMEIYDKGLSLTIACVSSGVSFEYFRRARKNRVTNEYKPQRW